MMRTSHLLLLFIFLILFSNCRNTKYLAEGEQLYTGATIKIVSDSKIKGQKALITAAKKAVKPKPNGKILGLRIKLWIYNKAPNTIKESGFKHWLKYKIGEKPVLISDVNPIATSEFINARIFNKGFFKSTTTFQIIESKDKKKAAVEYQLFPENQFIIKGIDYTKIADSSILKNIEASQSKSLLKVGMPYDLDLLRKERVRIDEEMKNGGYFYFSPDYLFYKIDSSSKDNDLNIILQIKPNIPKKALFAYKISSLLIKIDSSEFDHSYNEDADTVTKKNGITFIKSNPNFRPKPIIKSVFFNVGDLYSRKNHNQTLSRLNSMGVFKFVNLSIAEDSTNPQRLKVVIELSPLPKKTLSLEFEAASKSNSFIGPAANISFRHRNLLRGAEKLNIALHGSVETQITGQFKGLFTYEAGPTIKLEVPRFLLPFKLSVSRIADPKTLYTLDYTFSKRVNYFDMNSFKFKNTYQWKESISKEHILSPIDATYLQIRNISTDFTAILNTNPFLKQRFDDQLIYGASYGFFYNEQVYENKKNQIYFNGNIDLAGDIPALLSSSGSKNKQIEGPRNFLGVAFAQFARFDFDVRNYYTINPKVKWVNRLIVGVGLPHGNSTALPYNKSFFAGGPNSLRAFPINSVGPGSYSLPDSLAGSFFLQQGGDLKLEWNCEYRFPIWGFLRGAIFVDIGNTYLLNDNSALPGGKFNTTTFLDQLAVGTGFGLRGDFNFFVIRLDLGMPLRKPGLATTEKWVINQIDFTDGAWRGKNLILNLAIGYPF